MTSKKQFNIPAEVKRRKISITKFYFASLAPSFLNKFYRAGNDTENLFQEGGKGIPENEYLLI